MATESGCVDVTAQHIVAGKVVVTPAVQPVNGDASSRRTVGSTVRGQYKKVSVVGPTLEISLGRCRVGDKIFWTSYS